MSSIHAAPLPDHALLAGYTRAGAYTDCYATDVARHVSHAEFVTAFYTTPTFKLERLILKWAIAKPSTDAQAAQLAKGDIDAFAAWRVEQRGEDQLLLSDLYGRTKSWLMVASSGAANGASTRLYFGSAVVPRMDKETGKPTLGRGFAALLGFHRIYSRVLLGAARSRLLATARV